MSPTALDWLSRHLKAFTDRSYVTEPQPSVPQRQRKKSAALTNAQHQARFRDASANPAKPLDLRHE
jgi:hypothetical protein